MDWGGRKGAEPGDMSLMPPFRFHDARFWYHALIATGSLGFFLFFLREKALGTRLALIGQMSSR